MLRRTRLTWHLTAIGAFIVLAAGCGGTAGSETETADERSLTSSPDSGATSPDAAESPTATREHTTAPLEAFPIFVNPCRWLRKADFLEAMGDQRWEANEGHLKPGIDGWEEFVERFPMPVEGLAEAGASCVAIASQERALFLELIAVPDADDASTLLPDDGGREGLGDQANLGTTDSGGSGWVRVDRVLISLVVVYDDVSGHDGQLVVRDILGDLEPGFGPTSVGAQS